MPAPRISAIILLSLLAACSITNHVNLRDELVNQGPWPLSDTNPYLASNVFLAREVEQSSLLKGFLECRGTPDVIEIKQPFFGRAFFQPFQMRFIYLDVDESYLLEEKHLQWLIRGPENLPEDSAQNFHRFPQTNGRAPLLSEQNKLLILQDSSGAQNAVCPERGSVKGVGSQVFQPKYSMERGSEETSKETSAGDIIHRVSSSGETLDIIALWYTGSADNSGRIARINNIQDSNELRIGQSLRIPRYLVQQSAPLPLPQSEVERMLRR